MDSRSQKTPNPRPARACARAHRHLHLHPHPHPQHCPHHRHPLPLHLHLHLDLHVDLNPGLHLHHLVHLHLQRDVRAICDYANKQNTDEWDRRYLAIHQTWLMAGRAGECAWLGWSGISYDAQTGQVHGRCPQRKNQKMKSCSFGSGSVYQLSWYQSMANVMTAAPGPDDDAMSPFICLPQLRGVGRAGAAIGSWMKKAATGSNPGAMTPNPTAGGLRPGAINALHPVTPACS